MQKIAVPHLVLTCMVPRFSYHLHFTEVDGAVGKYASMKTGFRSETVYLSQQDILDIHSDIVQGDDKSSTGVLHSGDIDYALNSIEHGYFGQYPETIHEKSAHLIRLLAANHAFVDGNKRTALNTTWAFYFLNGYYLNYGEEIKALLNTFAVNESFVDLQAVVSHFRDVSVPIEESHYVEDDIGEVFQRARKAVNLLQEVEEQLEDVPPSYNPIQEINKVKEVSELFKEIVEIMRKSDSGYMALINEFIMEELKKLENVINELQDISEDE